LDIDRDRCSPLSPENPGGAGRLDCPVEAAAAPPSEGKGGLKKMLF